MYSMSKQCLYCNQVIDPNSFRGLWEYNRAKFCKKDCYSTAHAAKTEIKSCEFCKKEFDKKGSLGSNRFCCKECRYESKRTEGKKYVDSNGYVRLKLKHGYVFEHRHVVEQVLGRKLKSNEHVHHINENKQDNRPENLRVFESNAAHNAFHADQYRQRGEPIPPNRPEAVKKRCITTLRKLGCDCNSIL